MMNLVRWVGACGVWVLLAAGVSVYGAVLPGPTLTDDHQGDGGAGLRVVGLENGSFLQSFVFHNQGQADTVVLWETDGPQFIGQVDVPAGEPAFEALVNWPLISGGDYRLFSLTPGNSREADFDGFDVSDAFLLVTHGYFNTNQDSPFSQSDRLTTTTWFNFNNLRTGFQPVPEPATWCSWVGALLVSAPWRRHRS